jgi:hypothetical protein
MQAMQELQQKDDSSSSEEVSEEVRLHVDKGMDKGGGGWT